MEAVLMHALTVTGYFLKETCQHIVGDGFLILLPRLFKSFHNRL
jgi:hypothetical protein